MIIKLSRDEIIRMLKYYPEQSKFDWKQDLNIPNGYKKSELIKDVISIANAHGTSDGYILYGVDPTEEDPIKGITSSLDDATIQQIVNSKIDRPIEFLYFEQEIEGRKIGVIKINKNQKRPFIVKEDFGVLKKGTILIRRGSSTDAANYDDLQKMSSMPNEQISENRISELRISLIKQWQQNFSTYKVDLSEEPRISEMPSSLIEFVEENAVFEDIFHNFPNLRDAWNDFKALDARYGAERRKLLRKIKGYIEQKLKEHNLNLESETKKGFIYSVYSETILKTKGKNGGDYSESDVIVGGVIKRQLNIKYEKFGMVVSITVEQERIEEVKGIYKEIIEDCEKLYLVSINEVIEIERKVIDSDKKLKSALSKITYRVME